MLGTPIFSPDSQHVAYAAALDDKQFVVVDGKKEKPYDAIRLGSLVFSPDSRRVAYLAARGDREFIVVEGLASELEYSLPGSSLIFDSSTKLHTLVGRGDELFRVEVDIVEE